MLNHLSWTCEILFQLYPFLPVTFEGKPKISMNRKRETFKWSRGTLSLQSSWLLGSTGNSDWGMMSLTCTYYDISHSIVTSRAASWFPPLCVDIYLILMGYGVCWCVCACAQREIIPTLRGGKKLFNRGAHGGKPISNNVLFLQQQLCLTPMPSAAHYLSSHLFLHRLSPCLDMQQ